MGECSCGNQLIFKNIENWCDFCRDELKSLRVSTPYKCCSCGGGVRAGLPCYVYLIQCAGTEYYKIGFAFNPNSRLSSLQTGSPHKLNLVLSHWTPDRTYAKMTEEGLHRVFKKWHVDLEWFKFPDDIVERLREVMLAYTFDICLPCHDKRIERGKAWEAAGGYDVF